MSVESDHIWRFARVDVDGCLSTPAPMCSRSLHLHRAVTRAATHRHTLRIVGNVCTPSACSIAGSRVGENCVARDFCADVVGLVERSACGRAGGVARLPHQVLHWAGMAWHGPVGLGLAGHGMAERGLAGHPAPQPIGRSAPLRDPSGVRCCLHAHAAPTPAPAVGCRHNGTHCTQCSLVGSHEGQKWLARRVRAARVATDVVDLRELAACDVG
jgi:hypothetical protein